MLNKRILIFLTIIFFMIVQIPLFSEANVISNEFIKNGESYIFFVGGNGTGNYTKIQYAINNATNGDTIFVYNGTYYEHILIDKSIYLIGENKYTTIIDAGGNGDAVKIIADGLYFCNFTIQHTGIGNTSDVLKNSAIEIFSSNFHVIKNVICRDTNYGIWTEYSDNNLICDNIFYAYYDGISLDESKNNILRNNLMFGPGLVLSGSSIELLTHDIEDSNTANGKPVYYYLSKDSITVPNNAGQVILVNCSNCTVADLEISKVTDGIELLFSDNNTIRNNIITNTTDFGIRLDKSNYNLIENNKITYCPIGIGFHTGGFDGFKRDADCKYNTIINNSFEFNEFGIFLVMSNYNQILSNNFIKSKNEHACFVCSYCTHWSKNYWDDWIGLKYNSLRFFPKVIFGSPIKIVFLAKLWMNLDWNPAEEPYFDIQCTKIIYVDDDGCADYESIQDAINISNAGDTIYVYNGTYYENIVIDKPIHLVSENKNTTIIDGDTKGDAVSINCKNVTIQGFTITNGKTDIRLDICRAGIRVTASNCVIKENIIKDNQVGIFGLRVTNLTIFRNQFYGNGVVFSPYENYERPKIFMKYFIHNISENLVDDKPLLYLLNQKNLELTDPVGQIIAVNCSNIRIKNQMISYTDNGILLAYCSNSIVEESNISFNGGIWTFKSNNNIFRNNTFSNNFHGITLDYSSNNNIIENNYIANNLYAGVMIEYYSIDNHITKNDLINNTFSGYFTQAFRNRWDNNYYSDWIGLKHARMTFLPKLILGRPLDLYPKMGVCFNIDWNPSETPFS